MNTTGTINLNDKNQVLGYAFNREDGSLSLGSFISAAIGRKVVLQNISSKIDDFVFTETGQILYKLRVVYTNSSKTTVEYILRTV